MYKIKTAALLGLLIPAVAMTFGSLKAEACTNIIVTKGASMDSLSKKDVNYVSNMVNNYPRRKFNYHSPYEMALLFLNEKVLELNRLKHLPKNVVDLHPIIH